MPVVVEGLVDDGEGGAGLGAEAGGALCELVDALSVGEREGAAVGRARRRGLVLEHAGWRGGCCEGGF